MTKEIKFSDAFDKEFQDKILGCLFKVSEFASVAAQHLRPGFFDGVVQQNMAKIAIEHYGYFGGCMSFAAFTREVTLKLKEGHDEIGVYSDEYKRVTSTVEDYKYILENLIQWIKRQKWRQFVEDAALNHLADGKTPNFTKLEKTANAIINISPVCNTKPYDYFNIKNTIDRAKKRLSDLEESTGIRTGIAELDVKLYGYGWMPKELYLILAPPKRGKTMALLWFANAAVLRKKNVAYFTCEVSAHICSSRLDAMNSNTSFYDLPRFSKAVAKGVIEKIPAVGQLKIYEYPTKTLSPPMIEERLNDLIKTDGFVPDIVLIDYLDLLRPTIRSDNPYIDQGHIAEDLRGIAGKLNIPVLSASQIGRAGSSKEVTGGSDIAGSYDKIAIADQIITLSATSDDLKSRRLKIHLSESRNNESALLNIETDFAQGRFFKQFLSVS